jgi:thiosulfate reductase cytochrome b subunit
MGMAWFDLRDCRKSSDSIGSSSSSPLYTAPSFLYGSWRTIGMAVYLLALINYILSAIALVFVLSSDTGGAAMIATVAMQTRQVRAIHAKEEKEMGD